MFGSPPAIPPPRDLRSRLASALTQPNRNPAAKTESVTALPDLSGLGGRWFDSPDGPGYVIESIYEPGHEHGTIALHRALSIVPVRLAGQVRDPRLGDCPVEDFVYVDTETTGMGGAGSLVFLAGVARFEDGYLKLRQYLLPSPAYEGGLLGGVAREFETAGAFVSYNGKSFDIPMLETRYILSRREPNLRAIPHLDLLHPNRRLFRGSFDSHRLVLMERELLGFEREDDCPSAEVPARYFHFQRTADPTHIRPVLRHNAWDILSLVALAAHLAAVVDGREAPLQEARAATYEGNLEIATSAWQRVLDGRNVSRAHRLEALEGLARCSTRRGEWLRAAECWQSIAGDPRLRRISAFVELAKLQEHRLKQPAEALVAIEEAIALLGRGLVMPGPVGSEASRDALFHRRERLSRKSGCVRRLRNARPAPGTARILSAMSLWVAYLTFKPDTSPLTGLAAFERRKSFEHPHQATVLAEYWVNAPAGMPQVILAWESDDEAAGDYYEAAWGDIFDVVISQATKPVTELPETLPDIRAQG